MHCPRCGTVANAGQQFCRSCGLNLEKVAEIVSESIVSETSGGDVARLKDLQRKYESWGGIAGLIAFGLVLVLFTILVFSQMILRGGGVAILGSILILLAAAAAVMGYFQASAKSLKEKLAEPQLPQSSGKSLVTGSAGSPLFPPSSVTEQTTKLLIEQNDRTTDEIAS